MCHSKWKIRHPLKVKLFPRITCYSSMSSTAVILLLLFARSADSGLSIRTSMEVDEKPLDASNNSKTNCGLRPLRPSSRRSNDKESVDSVSQDDDDWDKIIGGSYVTYGDLPWQAGVKWANQVKGRVIYSHLCGAAIISEFWLLSAAHCFYGKDRSSLSVVIGDHHLYQTDREQFFQLDKIIIHEQFRATQEHDYDIALVKITPTANGRGIQFNDYVQPICLPDSVERPVESTQLIASGWGLYTISGEKPSEMLQQTTLPVLSQEDCQKLILERFRDYMLCAGFVHGSTDLCRGDSGGPAAYKSEDVYILYGIVSFGTGCSLPNYPVVLSSVPAFLGWIESTISRYSDNELQRTIPSRPTENY